jgi:hypothetical protein
VGCDGAGSWPLGVWGCEEEGTDEGVGGAVADEGVEEEGSFAAFSVSRRSAQRLKLLTMLPAAEQSQMKMHGLRTGE